MSELYRFTTNVRGVLRLALAYKSFDRLIVHNPTSGGTSTVRVIREWRKNHYEDAVKYQDVQSSQMSAMRKRIVLLLFLLILIPRSPARYTCEREIIIIHTFTHRGFVILHTVCLTYVSAVLERRTRTKLRTVRTTVFVRVRRTIAVLIETTDLPTTRRWSDESFQRSSPRPMFKGRFDAILR